MRRGATRFAIPRGEPGFVPQVGIREESDDRWLVSFMNVDLGYVEPRCNRFTPITSASPPAAI